MVNGLIAVVSLLVAVFCFIKFENTPDAATMYLIGGVVFAVLTLVFGGMFLSGRVNKSEDIHITE
jgi:hypothetical protein